MYIYIYIYINIYLYIFIYILLPGYSTEYSAMHPSVKCYFW